ncbi:hypothetical protein F4780DRAFT_473600 [Xylariomycetidae sp. FL0641]|nr:hypothetical protein F4780DRAFT_473600 [Xylariomycetidae sp. FL0641]
MLARHGARIHVLGRPASRKQLDSVTISNSLRMRRAAAAAAATAVQPPTHHALSFSTSSARRWEEKENQTGFGSYHGPRDEEQSMVSKMAESAATTFASVLVLAFGFAASAYIYHKSYKYLQLKKMQNAFEPGDPVLDLAAHGKDVPPPDADHWIPRHEQDRIDRIVAAEESGRYYLLIGEKGSGKSSMVLESMRKIDGEGCAMFEAHADMEIFRARLGKALDYEYHEDYIGGYFSERGPRESTALLDIERALNKLEKVALRHRHKKEKPLILIINQAHLIRDDPDGRDLLELLQQRAEQWAAANLVTLIFNTDHYWIYERFKLLATRMEVMEVTDLPKKQAIGALARYRKRYYGENCDKDTLEMVYERVGGRLSFLNKVAKSKHMLETCDDIKETEKTWFLNQCWILGSDMDDDVMDQQKWASAAMVLAQALVDKENEDAEREDGSGYHPENGHILPAFPMHKAQEIMTRADFLRELDNLNLFTISCTPQALTRASSVPMMRAFREVCALPGFRRFLDATLRRIGDIESLGRTRELVAKDLVLGGRYLLGKSEGKLEVTLEQKEEEEEEDEKGDEEKK